MTELLFRLEKIERKSEVAAVTWLSYSWSGGKAGLHGALKQYSNSD